MHESDLNFKMIMFHLVSKVVYTSKVVEACGWELTVLLRYRNFAKIWGKDRVVPVVDIVTQKTEKNMFENFVKKFKNKKKVLTL